MFSIIVRGRGHGRGKRRQGGDGLSGYQTSREPVRARTQAASKAKRLARHFAAMRRAGNQLRLLLQQTAKHMVVVVVVFTVTRAFRLHVDVARATLAPRRVLVKRLKKKRSDKEQTKGQTSFLTLTVAPLTIEKSFTCCSRLVSTSSICAMGVQKEREGEESTSGTGKKVGNPRLFVQKMEKIKHSKAKCPDAITLLYF
ncbi:hypothetical protein BC940DRAFT_51372 [Gongronella butleri]|nr:hypothetical protein BC940DRAFT_51372 [Gongronella butleri]